MPISLHLRLRVRPERRPELLAFLRDAVAFYEQPGGIRIRLLERDGDPTELVEVVEYDSALSYATDQDRVEHDPRMRQLLARWRGLLAEPPQVVTYRDITAEIAPGAPT